MNALAAASLAITRHNKASNQGAFRLLSYTQGKHNKLATLQTTPSLYILKNRIRDTDQKQTSQKRLKRLSNLGKNLVLKLDLKKKREKYRRSFSTVLLRQPSSAPPIVRQYTVFSDLSNLQNPVFWVSIEVTRIFQLSLWESERINFVKNYLLREH
jgi:hypothetical protein